jgi:hypothetical protein
MLRLRSFTVCMHREAIHLLCQASLQSRGISEVLMIVFYCYKYHFRLFANFLILQKFLLFIVSAIRFLNYTPNSNRYSS